MNKLMLQFHCLGLTQMIIIDIPALYHYTEIAQCIAWKWVKSFHLNLFIMPRMKYGNAYLKMMVNKGMVV